MVVGRLLTINCADEDAVPTMFLAKHWYIPAAVVGMLANDRLLPSRKFNTRVIHKELGHVTDEHSFTNHDKLSLADNGLSSD